MAAIGDFQAVQAGEAGAPALSEPDQAGEAGEAVAPAPAQAAEEAVVQLSPEALAALVSQVVQAKLLEWEENKPAQQSGWQSGCTTTTTTTNY